MGRELPQVPRNVLEDSTLGVAVRAEVGREIEGKHGTTHLT